MAISRIELLADVIVMQTGMYNSVAEPIIVGNYVPRFLRRPETKTDRARVIRNVTQLLELLERIHKDSSGDHVLPDEGTNEYDRLLAHVLCAILYAERKPVPLFEYLAAAQLEERLKQDGDLALFKAANFERPAECVAWLDPLIRFHKFATLVLGGRLRREIYDDIIRTGSTKAGPQFPVELGLLAAATYDTPGEDQVPSRNDRIYKVFATWAGLEDYHEQIPVSNADIRINTSRLVIAFDLPLCGYTPVDLIRDKFHPTILESFLQGWLAFKGNRDMQSKLLNLHLATIHYQQARLLSYDMKQLGELGTMGRDLSSIPIDPTKYEFNLYEYPNNHIYPSEFAEEMPPVSVMRLTERYAFTALLGTPIPPENFGGRAWVWVLENMPEPTPSEFSPQKATFYAKPVRNYIPLPLVARLLGHAHEYDASAFETLRYSYEGQLDGSFPSFHETFAPRGEVAQEGAGTRAWVTTVEKYLAAIATNIGICVGFDRVGVLSKTNQQSPWPNQVHNILMNKTAGYYLLLRYVETYMRSHDVSVSPSERLDQLAYNRVLKNPALLSRARGNPSPWSVGVDIGGTSIKFTLYHEEEQKADYRCGTAPAAGTKYMTLREFCVVLVNGVQKVLDRSTQSAGVALAWEDLDVVGITWPGAVRDQKVAGASGILGYFDESVASKWIRHSTVEMIRKLDLLAELRDVLKDHLKALRSKGEVGVTFSLMNDGNAEALGRVFGSSRVAQNFTKNTWAILKLGTGTAGAIVRDGVILPGLCEFGKLVLDVFQKGSHELQDRQIGGGRTLLALDQSPPGMNEYASAKLLPRVFREVANVSKGEGADYDSFEIGRLGSYYLGNETEPHKLDYDLGRAAIYNSFLRAVMSASDFDKICRDEADEDLKSKARDASLPSGKALYSECVATGRKRVVEYERWILEKYEDVRAGKGNYQECAKAMFAEVFDRAGSLLADCIMLLRDLYVIDGVVLCGGVFVWTKSTSRILESIQVHLDQRYHVRFCGFDVYEEDEATKHIRKRAISTIYHNFPSDLSTIPLLRSSLSSVDKGEIGALYHAKIIKYLSRVQPE